MGKFFPSILAILVAFCGVTSAVNWCLDLDNGRCTFESSHELNLHNCGIPDDDVMAGDLQACFENFGENNIHVLDLSSNDVTILPAGMFDSVVALTELELGYNDLTALPVGIFDSLPALKKLELNNNDLTMLPVGIFDSLSALTELDLQINALTELPAGIFASLPALTEVDLRRNALTTLPSGMFGSDSQLTSMDLRFNALTALPAGIFDSLPALTKLDLSYNSLTTLPAGISLPALTELILSENNLETLPDGLFGSDYHHLTFMDLSYNDLTTLPAGIFDPLVAMTQLDLSHNDLTTLPAAGMFGSDNQLTNMDLSDNSLSELPVGVFDHLVLLTDLDLTSNDLTTLPAGIFDSLPALTELHLSGNELTTLPAGIFDNLPALTELQLATNQLTTLPAGIFDNLPALTYLNLPNNDLMTLPTGMFDSLVDLTHLILRSNSLTTLPAGIFESLEAMTWLSLTSNPDLECLPTVPSTTTNLWVDDAIGTECGCDFGDFADPCSEEKLQCTPGSVGYTCAMACDPNNGNSDCTTDQVCCNDRLVCVDRDDELLYNPTACGDPHMFGFYGQKFDFTGEDWAWYSLIADDNMHINMRVTSPVPELPEITYITGLSVLATDEDGLQHTMVIEVREPHNLESSCPAGLSPCLADGSLRVLLDGEEMLLAPGTVFLGQEVQISAANLPGACRSFGFEKYWERKRLESATHGRRLGTDMSMGEWILGDPTATNMDECAEYVARAEVEEGGVYTHQSEHASFQIVTPKATVRLSHGRLHQIAMRDPTDKFDLPDHLTWQMNMAVDHNEVSRDAKGILGETFIPTRDANGKPIMAGMAAIRGQQEHYRVSGALGTDFVQAGHI